MSTAFDLISAESSRLLHRRAVRNAFLAAAICFAVGAISMFAYFSPASEADVAAARAKHLSTATDSATSYAECVKSLPPGRSVSSECGLAPADQEIGNFTQYLGTKTFVREVHMTELAQLIGLAFAAIAFLVGTAWMGAEWSTGSISLLATWEPNRLKLLLAKALALIGCVGIFAIGLQLTWIVTSLVLARIQGIAGPDPIPWVQLLGLQGRMVLLAMLAALGGFALANLTRSTAGAMGIAFGYTLVVEGAVRWLSPSGQAWLVSDNVLAFASPQNYLVAWSEDGELRFFRISNLQAGITMALVVGLMLLVGSALLRRQDLT